MTTTDTNTFFIHGDAKASFDHEGYIDACIEMLETNAEIEGCEVYHTLDMGDLGYHDLELSDVSVHVDLQHAVQNSMCSDRPDPSRFMGGEGEGNGMDTTLTAVREAYCATHDCLPHEYVANVIAELVDAAMVAARQSQMTEQAGEIEAVKLLSEQAVADRDKAQELYGKQARDMNRFKGDLEWCLSVMENMQVSDTVKERMRSMTAVLTAVSEAPEAENSDAEGVEDAPEAEA